MEKRIMFDDKIDIFALGRNGWSKQKGIGFYFYGISTMLEIQPINSRGQFTRCKICLPKENIPEFIKQLQEIIK
jgi:hypothetical protein